MDLEQQLRETYAGRLGALDVSAGDVGSARLQGVRMRARRRLTVAGATVMVTAVIVAGVTHDGSHRSVKPSAPEGHWREIPAAPLSPRALALGVWTGHEVLYLGGELRPCAPIFSCDVAIPTVEDGDKIYGYLRDGAAYDPRTSTWRPIASAPGYVESGDASAFAAGRWFVQTTSGWYAYTVSANTWSPFRARWYGGGESISTVGDEIYGLSRAGHGFVSYDARTSRWTTYPPDTLRPRLGGPSITGIPEGPVLTGYDTSKPYDVHRGSPALVDLWDGHGWRRLPQTGQMERGWVWTGRRLVDPEVGYQDKGDEHLWPKAVPYGGILDPTTGHWSPLPRALEDQTPGWQADAEGWPASTGGGERLLLRGVVYDDATGKSWPLPRPSGAPGSYSEAVWAEGRLIAFGGAQYTARGKLTGVSDRAWLYTP